MTSSESLARECPLLFPDAALSVYATCTLLSAYVDLLQRTRYLYKIPIIKYLDILGLINSFPTYVTC
jgi:hypothetical protein